MANLVGTCMDFKAYAHGHGIFHENMPKFGKTMGINTVYNVAIGIMNLFFKKFHFPSPRNDIFCE